jgi:VanZ family protein
MAITRTSRLVLWLLLGVVLLIMYGSLYPFHFKTDAIQGGFWAALQQLSWARAGRGDRISNVLLYLPLGFCLFLSLNRRYRRRTSLLLATMLGAMLSLAMEVAQVYVSVRVPSLTDLTLNAAGTLMGAAAGITWGMFAAWMPFPMRTERTGRDLGAIVVVGLWLAWRLAPFVPHFDLGKLKAALRPLFDPQFDAVTTFSYLVYWLIVSEALAALVSKPHTLEALLTLIAGVLVGRLIVANQTFVANELLALVILLPLLLITMRLAPRPKRWLLLGLLLIAFAIDRLSAFQSIPSSMDLWSGLMRFGSLLHQDTLQALTAIDIVTVFGRLFLFAALVWTIREIGVSMSAAVSAMVSLVVVAGSARLALNAASATASGSPALALLIDTLLAVTVALTFYYVHRQRRQRTLLARANSRRERSR